MTEVVFTDSKKGSMKAGQHFKPESGEAPDVWIGHSDGTQPQNGPGIGD